MSAPLDTPAPPAVVIMNGLRFECVYRADEDES